jgi:hypothetical protein
VLNIEQILRDVYKFYKNSSKRKKGLEEIALLRQQPLVDFLNNMTDQIKDGKADLEKRPSLRLKCWNATPWLGRSECLTSLCRAYEYILAYLSCYAECKGEPANKRLQARDLYEYKLTSYDIFLFIFFYKDLATTIVRTSKQLQSRDIRIRDVGSQILSLCAKLKVNYSETSRTPTSLLEEGAADDIMSELFGKDMDGILPYVCSSDA